MNVYNAEDIKKAIPIARYFRDQGVPLSSGDRCAAAVWRDGKNPSVSIDAEKGVWFDHVAGQGGTVIDAYIAIEGGTPLAAIRALGDRYGVAPVKIAAPPKKPTRGEALVADGYALVVTYTYTDEDGAPLYFVDRYERETPGGKVEKSFVQRSPTAENLHGVRRVLYNLPAVVKSRQVFIVEGEKDVETMRRLNLVATTNSGGGKYWQADFNPFFEGKEVVIIPDNDEVGHAHAAALLAQIKPLAASVKVVEVSKLPKGDITDYIEKEGGTVASLLEMVKDAPIADIPEDADVLRAKELNAEPLRNWVWGEPTVKGHGDKQRTITPKLPRGVDEVCAEVRSRFLNFPRRLGSVLFDYTRNADPKKRIILKIASKDEFKAWVNGTSCHQSDFENGGNFAQWAEVFARLWQTVPVYDGVARAPWYPQRDDVFPIYPILPTADPTHARFWELIDRFCPATDADRTLIAAFFCAPMFYNTAGQSPAWAIDTADAQGSGKTTLVNLCALLYGETPIGLDLKTVDKDLTQIKKRLLSSEGRERRIALFDNITSSFKGANLADFITAEKITGMAPYGHGEESRPNDLTWVATMNGGNVDTDMATRTYKLKIRKPTTYAPRWEQETRALIAANGPQILADIAHMMANSTERERHGSRFALFDAVVLSAVCATDAEFEAVAALIDERAKESNEDLQNAQELAETITRYMARFDPKLYADGEAPEAGCAWILRNADLDQIIRSSEGNIRNWTSKRVRRLIAEGNAPQFAPDFERINAGQMRTLAGQARAFCFFPSGSIDRAGEVTAQLIQVDSGRPKCVCKEPITLDKKRVK